MRRPLLAVLAASILVPAACAGRPEPDLSRRPRPDLEPRSERAAVPTRVAPRSDSLQPRGDGSATLVPAARIGDDRIDEGSGLAYAGGWWWTHNDSGDGPFLFRSRSAWFDTAERIEVPGAKAVDWEELAVLDGDLLVCDIGDNGRQRDDLTIYRVRPTEAGVETVATYPVSYPDGKHDAEGVWVWGGRVHVVLKNRGEEAHWVYRFPELRNGQTNTPRVIGSVQLSPGEQVTAADAMADGYVALLTYSQLMVWPADAVRGVPAQTFTLHARQCEALAWTESGVIFTNEQRDAYFIDRLLDCDVDPWLPLADRGRLPRIPRTADADAELELLADLPVRNLHDGEHVRMGLVRDRLVLDIQLDLEADVVPSEGRLGTSLLLAFSAGTELRATPDDPMFALTVMTAGRPVVPLNLGAGESTVDVDTISVESAGENGHMGFHVEIPVATLFPDGLPRQFRMALAGNGFRMGDDEPLFGALDVFSLLRPYAWGVIEVE